MATPKHRNVVVQKEFKTPDYADKKWMPSRDHSNQIDWKSNIMITFWFRINTNRSATWKLELQIPIASTTYITSNRAEAYFFFFFLKLLNKNAWFFISKVKLKTTAVKIELKSTSLLKQIYKQKIWSLNKLLSNTVGKTVISNRYTLWADMLYQLEFWPKGVAFRRLKFNFSIRRRIFYSQK